MPSISRRIYLHSFAVSAIVISLMAFIVTLVNDQLEITMLNIDLSNQKDFILTKNIDNQPVNIQSDHTIISYVPRASEHPTETLHPLFKKFPIGFSGEIIFDGREYLINIDPDLSGTFYIARDITAFEDGEAKYDSLILATAVVTILLSLALAILSSRRIVLPLQKLTRQISATPVAKRIPKIEEKFADKELQSIANTFNQYLTETEKFILREQSLVNLASHELRTPIAVILGALEVLEHRDGITDDNRVILERIYRAASEMQNNTSTMLKLARKENHADDVNRHFQADNIIGEVIDDLSLSHDMSNRVQFHRATQDQPALYGDPTLAKMLFRNLVQNALQHTQSTITIESNHNTLSISDQGIGLSSEQQSILQGQTSTLTDNGFNGLGLYIVTLICERLNWKLKTDKRPEGGTTITVKYHE